MTFNYKEYGSVLRVNLGTDISTGTDIKVILEAQRGEEDEFTTNIVVGTSNVTVDDAKFLANQYLEYTLQVDDLDRVGQWRARGEATVSGERIKGDFVKFTVLS